ncbi:trehalose-phosphatase [Roseibacterium sp. SDUM158017]|uniref:trehalose-phosphatase n=1 Tax=Roseicyclus salinarum TaxID=3036773 RepID=UPI0024156515|nr:trehalose-phosphatase [Roseibacterium sp. SDUM158017]MDG4647831.1 trehalose-phosphatase [Roseibacterium sp. SDUM158017]
MEIRDARLRGEMKDPREQAEDTITAVIMDMDGVVTDTAEAHFAAWKGVFDDLLKARGAEPPFSREDYLAHVDGLPRHEGIRRFLAARGIDLPEGRDDDDGIGSQRGIGNLKNHRFHDWLDRERVPVFDDARALIETLKATGMKLGVFSASRNARRVLQSAGLADAFDTVLDGADAADLGLAPKPAPDQLLRAARQIGGSPETTLVIEDAEAGVEAAAAGRFALVVGIDRQGGDGAHGHALRVHGADLVTRDLRRLLLPGGAGLKTLDTLPSVWEGLDAITERLGARAATVFLDFDGTLSPIVPDYRDAAMPKATRAAVGALAARGAVAIISGRDLADLRQRVGVGDVIYAGSHGFDIAGPGGMAERPEEAEGFREAIAEADTALREALSGIEGARIERKTFAIAVHYREAQERDLPRIEAAVDRVAARHDRLRKGRGKKVIELQPRADWDKGRAVAWLLAHTPMGQDGALPVYVGDDLTDEDAFAALADDGLLIAVRGGGRPTLANYALADPDDVRRFVDWLADREGAAA